MAGLNAGASVGIICENPVSIAIEVVEASANIDLHLPADIDLILPEARVHSIGLICFAHDRESRDGRIGLAEVGQADRREFVEAAVLGNVGPSVEVTVVIAKQQLCGASSGNCT